MFLIGNIVRNLITALEFPQLNWFLFYGSKQGNIDFHSFFYCNFKTIVSTEIDLYFLSSLEHFQSDTFDTLSEVAFSFEEIHKVFECKVQECSTPLRLKIKDARTKSHRGNFLSNK